MQSLWFSLRRIIVSSRRHNLCRAARTFILGREGFWGEALCYFSSTNKTTSGRLNKLCLTNIGPRLRLTVLNYDSISYEYVMLAVSGIPRIVILTEQYFSSESSIARLSASSSIFSPFIL